MTAPINLDAAREKSRRAELEEAQRLPPPSRSGLDQRLAFFPLTELGNAERLVERHRNGFLWCPTIVYLVW